MAAPKKYPPVVVVDEHDHVTGSAMLAEVWQKGLYHRVVSVYVKDGQGRMLLQFRTPSVKIYPNCWDPAAGGHVDEGCSYDQAAATELAEELGLHDIPLKELGTFQTNTTLEDGRIINQFERVYVARVSGSATLMPERDEISKLQWFTAHELKSQIASHADEFTPGLLHGLRAYFPEFHP
jgi:isopentenyl-diphosphate delta-isomerase